MLELGSWMISVAWEEGLAGMLGFQCQNQETMENDKHWGECGKIGILIRCWWEYKMV